MSSGNGSAIISSCGKYRYRLDRRVGDLPGLGLLLWGMLNPSTANADEDDPTIRKCAGFTTLLGFGSFAVVNLFAWRSTDPKALPGLRVKSWNGPSPTAVGPENDQHIREAVAEASLVVCGWGSSVKLGARAQDVLDLIRSEGQVPHALKINRDGSPSHPLYLSYKLTPKAMP